VKFRNRNKRDLQPHAEWICDPVCWEAVPEPTVPELPRWYRELERSLPQEDMRPRQTVKACIPFRDAITAGWVIRLHADTRIRVDGDVIQMNWRMLQTGATHATSQIRGMFPDGTPHPMKWELPWMLKLPPGYSALYTPPLNDVSLPFRVFSGIVENDVYPDVVNMPFYWVGDNPCDVVIHKGTPLVQVIPFRREEWSFSSRVMTPEEKRQSELETIRVHTEEGYYAKNRWTRKIWNRKASAPTES